MENFKERLIKERDELKEKHTKLNNFLLGDKTGTINHIQLSLLIDQKVIMYQYLCILNKRIELL